MQGVKNITNELNELSVMDLDTDVALFSSSRSSSRSSSPARSSREASPSPCPESPEEVIAAQDANCKRDRGQRSPSVPSTVPTPEGVPAACSLLPPSDMLPAAACEQIRMVKVGDALAIEIATVAWELPVEHEHHRPKVKGDKHGTTTDWYDMEYVGFVRQLQLKIYNEKV